MIATFDRFEDVTDTIKTFYFKTEKPFSYTAGQFVELTLKHPEPDNRGQKRWFTLSSSPTEKSLAITTRIQPDGGSTFKQALDILQPHHKVDISEPMGDFVLPKLSQIPLVFVAGGIGITPFHSIAKWLADTGERRQIHLIHAVAHEDDIIFQEVFDDARIHETIVVSQPSAAWGGERGRVSAQLIKGLDIIAPDTQIYLSGPEPMLEQLQKDLVAADVPKRQIITDFFPGYSTL